MWTFCQRSPLSLLEECYLWKRNWWVSQAAWWVAVNYFHQTSTQLKYRWENSVNEGCASSCFSSAAVKLSFSLNSSFSVQWRSFVPPHSQWQSTFLWYWCNCGVALYSFVPFFAGLKFTSFTELLPPWDFVLEVEGHFKRIFCFFHCYFVALYFNSVLTLYLLDPVHFPSPFSCLLFNYM